MLHSLAGALFCESDNVRALAIKLRRQPWQANLAPARHQLPGSGLFLLLVLTGLGDRELSGITGSRHATQQRARFAVQPGRLHRCSHLVLNNADDGRDNRPGDAASYRLASKSADVDVIAYTRHHRN